MTRNSSYYWSEDTYAPFVSGDMPTKDAAIYGASAVVGALIFKSFIAGPLGLLAGAAAGLMGASAVIKGR